MASITYQCPQCPNTEFKQLTKIGTIHANTGLYRCECTVCGHIETIRSKSPFNNGISSEGDRKDRKILDEIKKHKDLNQYE